MHVEAKALKKLDTSLLTQDEGTILKWIRRAKWEQVADARDPIPYKAKVPEFFGGVRMYRVQAGGATPCGALGGLELFIKKLEFQGVLARKDLYPVAGQGTQPRYLSLIKGELDNLGVGAEEDED